MRETGVQLMLAKLKQNCSLMSDWEKKSDKCSSSYLFSDFSVLHCAAIDVRSVLTQSSTLSGQGLLMSNAQLFAARSITI